MVCVSLEDFPLVGYEGNYTSLQITRCFNLKTLKTNSFPGISAEYINIIQVPELTEIQDGFIQGSEDKVQNFYIQTCPKLTSEMFPWNYTSKFTNLKEFHMQFMDIETVPGFIQWSPSVQTIRLQQCEKLNLIEPFAFSTATNLSFLELYTTGNGLKVKPNGFHTMSKNQKQLLHLWSYSGSATKLEANAFGNENGGELWDSIAIPTTEFPENVFRSMMKTAAEQNAQCKQVFVKQ